jgi:hypothetical protein
MNWSLRLDQPKWQLTASFTLRIVGVLSGDLKLAAATFLGVQQLI